MRLIDADKRINLQLYDDMNEEWSVESMTIAECLDRYTEEGCPPADRPQEWTPCSERLPSEEEQDEELGVLVTLGNGYSGLQYDWYHDGYWYDWNGFVVAWMPLPEPWKGADDE